MLGFSLFREAWAQVEGAGSVSVYGGWTQVEGAGSVSVYGGWTQV